MSFQHIVALSLASIKNNDNNIALRKPDAMYNMLYSLLVLCSAPVQNSQGRAAKLIKNV